MGCQLRRMHSSLSVPSGAGRLCAVLHVGQKLAPRHAMGVERDYFVSLRRVLTPVRRGITIWVYRHTSQSVCPWNVKFSQALAEDSPFRAREFLAGKDAVTLAQDILALDQEAFSAAFRKSPMKRAKLVGLRRNAAVVFITETER